LKVHVIINDSYTTLDLIKEWLRKKKYSFTFTNAYRSEKFPSKLDFDLLIILGGTVGSYEEEKYPWLKEEKKYIKKSIENNKLILGICLGAQMIAEILGGKVYPHRHSEIGWFNIKKTKFELEKNKILKNIDDNFLAFQFHNDTFDLPEEATLLAGNDANKNQAFMYKENVIGLQFHPEINFPFLEEVFQKYNNIEKGPYVQNIQEILKRNGKFKKSKENFFIILNNIERIFLEKE